MNEDTPAPSRRRLLRRAAVASTAISAVAAASIFTSPMPAQAAVLGVQIVGTSVSPPGARVGDVIAGSPAVDAELLPGDIITNLNGKAITSADEFIMAIGKVAIGDWISLSFSGATGAYRAAVLPLEPVDDPTGSNSHD